MSDGRKYPKKDEEIEVDDFGDPVSDLEKPNILLILTLLALVIGVSWVLTCGILWFIARCFSIDFNLSIATGVWLCMWLVGSVFKK